MWHFTDVFYHTDADRLDMVSAQEMKNVGVSALATAFALTAANEATTTSLISELQKNATDRLQEEYDQSILAIKSGSTVDAEKHKIDVWAKWYIDAIGKMTDINVSGTTTPITVKIAFAKRSITDLSQKLDGELK
jgi:aminopeptidase YwaD